MESAFLLIKTNLDSRKVMNSILSQTGVVWANNTFGPNQIIVYIEDYENKLIETIEELRSRRYITELDARIVKKIPEDKGLKFNLPNKKERAVLLINVNYKEEKERIITKKIREINGACYARAMWGPTDVIAIVESNDKESMRNLICDKIKTMKGINQNTTMYCYPS